MGTSGAWCSARRSTRLRRGTVAELLAQTVCRPYPTGNLLAVALAEVVGRAGGGLGVRERDGRGVLVELGSSFEGGLFLLPRRALRRGRGWRCRSGRSRRRGRAGLVTNAEPRDGDPGRTQSARCALVQKPVLRPRRLRCGRCRSRGQAGRCSAHRRVGARSGWETRRQRRRRALCYRPGSSDRCGRRSSCQGGRPPISAIRPSRRRRKVCRRQTRAVELPFLGRRPRLRFGEAFVLRYCAQIRLLGPGWGSRRTWPRRR